ncbi:Uncharacterised protein [Mycobacteroides abscessus subsp. abscessus]|nr:Uncharacterised protein [Mycobacteroides abscessus subsp. abscessus]
MRCRHSVVAPQVQSACVRVRSAASAETFPSCQRAVTVPSVACESCGGVCESSSR